MIKIEGVMTWESWAKFAKWPKVNLSKLDIFDKVTYVLGFKHNHDTIEDH